MAVGIGDLGLAYQAFKIAVSVDSHHAESFNNLGVRLGRCGFACSAGRQSVPDTEGRVWCVVRAVQVLELRKGNVDQARSNFQTAQSLASYMFEPFFNGALLAYKLGDFQDSFELCQKSLEAFPDYADSKELIKQLRNHFTT